MDWARASQPWMNIEKLEERLTVESCKLADEAGRASPIGLRGETHLDSLVVVRIGNTPVSAEYPPDLVREGVSCRGCDNVRQDGLHSAWRSRLQQYHAPPRTNQ